MRLLFAIVLIAPLATGCVAFVAPPVRASASVGATLGTFHGVEPNAGGEATRYNPTVVEARIAAHPLAYVQELSRRRIDFGIGYTGVFFPWDAVLSSQHGGHGEVGWYALENEYVRLQLSMRGELLQGRTPTLGGGGGVSVLFEVRHFSSAAGAGFDASHAGIAAGAAWGELALGVRLDATARFVDGDPCLAATAGIVIGAPVTAAFAGYPEAAVQMLRVLAH